MPNAARNADDAGIAGGRGTKAAAPAAPGRVGLAPITRPSQLVELLDEPLELFELLEPQVLDEDVAELKPEPVEMVEGGPPW
jgi:hypothetical protein